MRNTTLALITAFALGTSPSRAQSLYFPPLIGNTWEATDPSTLGWCPDRIDSLYAFLGDHGTKAFLLLKDGRIVLEHYFGTFTQDSLWYWASAGKTLTSLTTGIAQEEGYLSIDSLTSHYIGAGWSSEPPDKEALITVRDQLTMTSGLDDGVPDNHCTLDTCLQYLADAGTRWAYQNAPYTLLDELIGNATGQPFTNYFYAKVRNPIGMGGVWFNSDYDHVYASKARGMARYGLLALNHFVWNTDTLIHDTAYIHAMTHPSQAINHSYGYLWWLNGYDSYMLPGTQFVFPGELFPHAPDDMFNALGKNDQLLNVSPSTGFVMVRLGNVAYQGIEVPVILDDQIWQRIDSLSCMPLGIEERSSRNTMRLSPNPCTDQLRAVLPAHNAAWNISIIDAFGRTVLEAHDHTLLEVGALPAGAYVVRATSGDRMLLARAIKR